MMSIIHRRAWLAGLPVVALLGCTTALQPSRELLAARSAYQHAESSPAARLVPAELHVARVSLDVAEQSFTDAPKSQNAVDNAYVAMRKAQRAEALGELAAATAEKARAEQAANKTRQEMLSSDEAQLRRSRGELARERDNADKARAEANAEHEGRIVAEQKARDAMDALAKTLAMEQDERGTVITLSGGVLFATGQATILPGAQAQLNEVANALQTQAEHHFIVAGHTDNQGTDVINDDLSTRRANAVRDYLVVHGVSANAISAQGYGSHQPIAENGSVEGRAMNRRVEIIVAKNTTAQR